MEIFVKRGSFSEGNRVFLSPSFSGGGKEHREILTQVGVGLVGGDMADMGSQEGQQLIQGSTWMSQEVSKRLGSVGYFPNTMVPLSLLVWVPCRFFDVHGLYGGHGTWGSHSLFRVLFFLDIPWRCL